MQKYQDLTGKSEISHFDIQPEKILIKFNKKAEILIYSYDKVGKNHVENLKKLAISGAGLNRYIIKNFSHLNKNLDKGNKINWLIRKFKLRK
ncbi:MAG: hypothetical protein Q8K70_10380 [Bacteroidota bacterium]|nr:hypothetical protein [Bacteroidota bacterium]